jgi:hypothetical protein
MSNSSSANAVRRLVDPLKDFLHTESAGGLFLLAATVVALGWANSPGRPIYPPATREVIASSPKANSSQPTGFAGRRLATTTPTVAVLTSPSTA